MGQKWDTGDTAFAVEFWAEVLRVLKPGGHVVAFGGTRTYHRLACAIEDAGFDIRDCCFWHYATGFPKSRDVARDLRGKGLTAEQVEAWEGFGTALKPATEPICLARKPLVGTIAENVLAYGTGALNIDGCRVDSDPRPLRERHNQFRPDNFDLPSGSRAAGNTSLGRFPANVLHDGSPEVLAALPDSAGQQGAVTGDEPSSETNNVYGQFKGRPASEPRGDTGSAARFFYSAKASKLDRLGSSHPTVKPVDLMRWLVRLVTPRGGLVLDPFAGSGTTGHAAVCEGMRAVLIEREAAYCRDIVQRMNRMDPNGQPKARKPKPKPRPPNPWAGTLFAASPPDGAAQQKVTKTSCVARQNRATLATLAQPSKLAPTIDGASGSADDSRAVSAALYAAE